MRLGILVGWPNNFASIVANQSTSVSTRYPSELEISAAGGRYRLCWGAALTERCALPIDFQTDFGMLTVIGVSPLAQDNTCISGSPCTFDGVVGVQLSVSDRFLLLDTCGMGSAPSTLGHVSSASSALASGKIVSWGNTALTAAGGHYRLCWCAGARHLCDIADQFRTDAGTLTMVGPSPLSQDRTCVTGRVCTFGGLLGVGLSSSNSLMILDTCADNALSPRFTDGGLDVSSTAFGTAYSWGSVRVTAGGGLFRLCWSEGSLGVAGASEPTRLDVGRLTMIGPRPLMQHRTCVSGSTCAFDGIVGEHLATNDRYLILDTCGGSHVLARFLGVGSVTEVVTAAIALADLNATGGTGSRVTWGAGQVTSAGGRYRLCWCAGPLETAANLTEPDECQRPEGFHVDVGELSLIGVSPLSQDRTCTSGQMCSLGFVQGKHLSEADRYVVLQTCGSRTAVVPRVSEAGSAEVQIGLPLIQWGGIHQTSAGGRYRLQLTAKKRGDKLRDRDPW